MCAWCMSHGLTLKLMCAPPFTHTPTPTPKRMNPTDFGATSRLTFLNILWNETTWQPLGWLAWNADVYVPFRMNRTTSWLFTSHHPRVKVWKLNFELVTFSSASSCPLPLVLPNVSMLKRKANRNTRDIFVEEITCLITFFRTKKKKRNRLVPIWIFSHSPMFAEFVPMYQ